MSTKDDEKDLEEKNLDEDQLEEDLSSTDDNDASEDGKPTSTDWEKSYKGLQTSAAKKQQAAEEQIKRLQAKVEELTEGLEGGKTNETVLVRQLDETKKLLEEAQKNLDVAQTEKASLDNLVKRNDLIAQKFPKLSPFQNFIPEGTDLEEFEKNAEAFQASLGVYTENFLSGQVEGASPPPPSGEEKIDESEEERLWNIVSSTAGISGKEAEYDKAYAAWLDIQNAKQES